MKILVAVDASQSSHHALEQVMRLINLQGANFLLLSVEEIVPIQSNLTSSASLGINPENPISLYDEIELVHIEERRTQSALLWAENFCKQRGVDCTTRFEIGEPKNIICDVANEEKPDLIVVGSEGRNLIERTLMGSVSDYVIHHTHYPVLIVHNDVHQDSDKPE